MTSGFTSASISMLASMLSIIVRLRSLCPSGAPGVPRAIMRLKCKETPFGANIIISGSTVGLPGGTRKPSRALHPIIAASATGSTHAGNRHRLDLVHDAHFTRPAKWILVFAEIFLGQRVYMRVGAGLGRVRNAAADLDIAIRLSGSKID